MQEVIWSEQVMLTGRSRISISGANNVFCSALMVLFRKGRSLVLFSVLTLASECCQGPADMNEHCSLLQIPAFMRWLK